MKFIVYCFFFAVRMIPYDDMDDIPKEVFNNKNKCFSAETLLVRRIKKEIN